MEVEVIVLCDVNNGLSIFGLLIKFLEFLLLKDGCNWDYGVVLDFFVVRGEVMIGVDEF